jgi:hypothetical protein
MLRESIGRKRHRGCGHQPYKHFEGDVRHVPGGLLKKPAGAPFLKTCSEAVQIGPQQGRGRSRTLRVPVSETHS